MNEKINKVINIDIDVQNLQSLKAIEKHIKNLMSLASNPAFQETRKILEAEVKLIQTQNVEKRRQLNLQDKLNRSAQSEYNQMQKSLEMMKEKNAIRSRQGAIDRLARAEIQTPVEAVKSKLAESIGQSREQQALYKGVIKAPILSKDEEAELKKLSDKKRLTKVEKARKAELTTKVEEGTAAKAAASEQLAKAEQFEVGAAAVMGVINGVSKLAKGINDTFKSVLGFSLSIKDNFKDIVKNIGEMLSLTDGIATYSTSTSLITNVKARETQMKYGLSEAGTYGLTQAMAKLNLTSDDDLMYMNSRQQQYFSNYLDKYSEWFDRMQSSGVLDEVQQMQLDFSFFKDEISMEFLSFIAENKDTIMTAIRAIINVVKFLIEAITKILTFFNLGHVSSTTSDYIQSSSSASYNNSRSISISMNNTATGVLGSQEAFEDFFNSQMETAVKETLNQIN